MVYRISNFYNRFANHHELASQNILAYTSVNIRVYCLYFVLSISISISIGYRPCAATPLLTRIDERCKTMASNSLLGTANYLSLCIFIRSLHADQYRRRPRPNAVPVGKEGMLVQYLLAEDQGILCIFTSIAGRILMLVERKIDQDSSR